MRARINKKRRRKGVGTKALVPGHPIVHCPRLIMLIPPSDLKPCWVENCNALVKRCHMYLFVSLNYCKCRFQILVYQQFSFNLSEWNFIQEETFPQFLLETKTLYHNTERLN